MFYGRTEQYPMGNDGQACSSRATVGFLFSNIPGLHTTYVVSQSKSVSAGIMGKTSCTVAIKDRDSLEVSGVKGLNILKVWDEEEDADADADAVPN